MLFLRKPLSDSPAEEARRSDLLPESQRSDQTYSLTLAHPELTDEPLTNVMGDELLNFPL